MPTSRSIVESAVFKVLRRERIRQGFDDEDLTVATVPLTLDKFDSQMGLVMTLKISRDLGIKLPAKVNLFVHDNGKERLSIEQAIYKMTEFVKVEE